MIPATLEPDAGPVALLEGPPTDAMDAASAAAAVAEPGPWTLPAADRPGTAAPEAWLAGPRAWGASPGDEVPVWRPPWRLIAAGTTVAVGALWALVGWEAAAATLALFVFYGLVVGIPTWASRADDPLPGELEHRVLDRELYGLVGRCPSGMTVDHLPQGTVVALGRNPAGELCAYTGGREYRLDHDLLVTIRGASHR